MTTEEFIQKAKAVHGDKYDYSKVEYVNSYTKICITCPTHGEFPQNPNNHLQGNGCPTCARIRRADNERKTTEWFIAKAKQVHGNRFDYSKVKYINNHTPIIISCPIHGEFMQTPSNHLKGQGCPACGYSKHRQSQEEALRRIERILIGTPYEVVQPFIYQGDRDTSVKLHCTLHNETWQISWHSLIYDTPKNKTFSGCSGCRQTYSKEQCEKAALACKRRSEFAVKYKGEYFKALREGWLDEICAHMKVVGNRYKRCIYAYVFEESKYVYVGLTGDIEKRDKEHRVRLSSSVYRFAAKNNLSIPPIQQMSDYLQKEDAAILEGEILKQYIAKGYRPINITKTGGLGGHLQNDGYTFEQCEEASTKYSKRSEWKKQDYPTYYIASKLGWIDTIMPQNKPFGNNTQRCWTIERCCDLAKECKSISEFRQKNPSAYGTVCKNKWNDVVFSNIPRLHPPTGFTIEIIKEKLKGYSSTSDFVKENPAMLNWLGHHKVKLSDIATPEQIHKSHVNGTKPIVQCDMEGIFVAEYSSAREAIGFDFRSISACCNGICKSHKGYKWFFKQDYEREHSKE